RLTGVGLGAVRADGAVDCVRAAYVKAVRTGGPMPVALESLVATTAATLAVPAALAAGVPVTLTGAP
ncbi:hypothetical protein, partial [Streptomyces sp. NPDC058953]|uniref:hypothetical protein n=1 Tax=Streptomyces sp. NPDC058953 TaxID=3346676 RepID=UPI0036A969AD